MSKQQSLRVFGTAIWLFLVALCMAGITYADIAQDKICSRTGPDGVCERYVLDYNGYTLEQYKQTLEGELSESEIAKTHNLLGSAAQELAADAEYSLSIFIFAQSLFESPPQEQEVALKASLLWMVNFLLVSGKTYYPDVSETDMAKGVHMLFSVLHGLDVTTPFSTDFLSFDAKYHAFTFEKTRVGNTESLEVNLNPEAEKFFPESALVPCILNILHAVYKTSHWNSLASADWLMSTIPELKEGLVVELGAGNGHLSELLKTHGALVKATDIKALKGASLSFRSQVEVISASRAISKYPDASCFLAVLPGWAAYEDITRLSKTEDWCYALIIAKVTEGMVAFNRQLRSAEVEVVTLPESLFGSVFYTPKPETLLIYRSKSRHKKSIFHKRVEL